MTNRLRGSRGGFRRGRGSQARPMMAAERRAGPGPGARRWLGWAAAAAIVAAVAFIVGRAGSEIGLPSPVPSASAATPLKITFGTALDPVSGQATQLTNRFRVGDSFAYSFELAAAPGVDRVLVEIVRLDGDGETVVQEPTAQGIVPASRTIAFTVKATDLLAAWGPGTFVMRVFLGGPDPIAVGRFTLVEPPSVS